MEFQNLILRELDSTNTECSKLFWSVYNVWHIDIEPAPPTGPTTLRPSRQLGATSVRMSHSTFYQQWVAVDDTRPVCSRYPYWARTHAYCADLIDAEPTHTLIKQFAFMDDY